MFLSNYFPATMIIAYLHTDTILIHYSELLLLFYRLILVLLNCGIVPFWLTQSLTLKCTPRHTHIHETLHTMLTNLD